MILPELTLALVLAPTGSAEEVLAAADEAAQAFDYERATELCLELAAQPEVVERMRQDALQAALGYADMALEETGTPRPLCHAYKILRDVGRGDVLALQPEIEKRLELFAGPDWRTTCSVDSPGAKANEHIEVEQPAAAPKRVRLALLPVSRTEPDAPQHPKRPRPPVIAGATLVSIGAASLAGLTGTLIVWNRNANTISDHTTAVEAGAEKTPDRNSEVERLHASGSYLLPLAITTGALSAITVVTGTALLITGHKRSRQVAVTPRLASTFGGVTLTARF